MVKVQNHKSQITKTKLRLKNNDLKKPLKIKYIGGGEQVRSSS